MSVPVVPIATIERSIAALDRIIADYHKEALQLLISDSGVPPTAAAQSDAQQTAPSTAQAPKESGKGGKSAKKGGKKEKAANDDKSAAAAAGTVAPEIELFSKANLRVGRVLEAAEQEGSDKLYKCQVDLGGDDKRQIMAGLQQHIPKNMLQGALVVVAANLKTAKLAGQPSQGMILAAEQATKAGAVVRTIIPPGDAKPGDRVQLQGQEPLADSYPKEMRSTHWKGVAEGLKTKGGHACFQQYVLCTASGPISIAPEIGDDQIIK